MTHDILESTRFRDTLYIQWKKTRPISDKYTLLEKNVKSFCAILQKNIRSAKAKYHHEQFEKYKNDIKKTWKHIKEIVSKKNKSSQMPKYFIDNSKILTDDIDIADCFNNYFSHIGPSLAKSIKSPPA